MSSPGPPAKAAWPPGSSAHRLHTTRPAVHLEAFALAGPPAQTPCPDVYTACFVLLCHLYSKVPNRVSLPRWSQRWCPSPWHFIFSSSALFFFSALTRIQKMIYVLFLWFIVFSCQEGRGLCFLGCGSCSPQHLERGLVPVLALSALSELPG